MSVYVYMHNSRGGKDVRSGVYSSLGPRGLARIASIPIDFCVKSSVNLLRMCGDLSRHLDYPSAPVF